MHPQSLFSMLDQVLKSQAATDPHFVEFSLESEPVRVVLGAILFEQLCAGCGGQVDPSMLVVALGPEVLWRHAQGHLAKVVHCCRGGGLKVQIGYEPSRPFFDMRRQALYAMAGHLTHLN